MSTKNNQCRLQGNWEITYYVEHGSLMETQNFNQYKEKDLLVCFIFPAVCLSFMVWNFTFLDCVDVLSQELHMVFKATFDGIYNDNVCVFKKGKVDVTSTDMERKKRNRCNQPIAGNNQWMVVNAL